MSKFHGDVRPLSHDSRYMGVVFSGPVKQAIAQAKAAPDHGKASLPDHVAVWAFNQGAAGKRVSGDRLALLQHLNLVPQS